MRATKRAVRSGFLVVLAAFVGGLTAQAASASNLSYYGGPVAHSMTGLVVDWGPGENSAFTNESTGDPGLLKYWASQNGSTGDIGGVLAQYIDKSQHNSANRVAYGGQYPITPANASPVLSDQDIQNELNYQLGQHHLPGPLGDGLSTVYMVLLPPTKQVCDVAVLGGCSGVDFCAYHSSASAGGSHLLYTVVAEGGLCNNSLAEQTVSFSHEWGEAINDPLVGDLPLNAPPGPPLAWYDNSGPPPGAGEIGDKCEGSTATNGPWTVALLWSNRDSGCLSQESSLTAPNARFVADSAAGAGAPALFDGRASSDSNSTSATDIGDPGNMTYSIAAGIAGYSWHWGDGTPDGSGAAPKHTFAHQGSYQVTLTVTDNLGFSSSVTQRVSVGPASAGQRPKVKTGSHRVHGVSVTLRARVNPRGLATQYHFEFGRTRSYGRSSTRAFAGSGKKAKLVKIKLVGLRPHTLYHFRIVATNARGTAVGRDKRFKTGRRLRHVTRFKLSARAHGLGDAVTHGLRVSFSCPTACDVHAAALRLVAGPAARRILPATVARGSASLGHGGTATVVLHFTPAAASLLRASTAVPLVISAVADGDQGAGVPALSTVTLRR